MTLDSAASPAIGCGCGLPVVALVCSLGGAAASPGGTDQTTDLRFVLHCGGEQDPDPDALLDPIGLAVVGRERARWIVLHRSTVRDGHRGARSPQIGAGFHLQPELMHERLSHPLTVSLGHDERVIAGRPMDSEAPVRIGLLGPLTLQVDGRAIEVNGPRRRGILAVLAASLGRTVSTGILLEDVFFDVPATAQNTLHVHISQLRSLLAPYGKALERQGTGYRLNDASCGTDAARLDRAVAAIRDSRARPVIDQLRAALDDCAGPFCQDVPMPALESRRAYYAELQLSASELLFDAELQQGGGPDLPERIESVLSISPLRERLWGQLMLALYIAGRQSEALSAYRRARAVLAGEGGLDPGPALRELEALILRQADSVDGVTPVLPISSAPTLVWLDASGALQAQPILGGVPLVIGRSADCDVRIDWDPLVSRRHASVERTAEGFEVRDLGSTNGCHVDGSRVSGAVSIELRGTLQVGDTALFLRAPTRRVGSRVATIKSPQLPEHPEPQLPSRNRTDPAT